MNNTKNSLFVGSVGYLLFYIYDEFINAVLHDRNHSLKTVMVKTGANY